MENYILLKDLPDASAGTKVIWNENANAYSYEKSIAISPHFKNYLSAGTVTQSPEWFTKEIKEPPIGIKPMWLHTEHRLQEINNAIKRYACAGCDIPHEWIEEKQTLESYLNERKDSK